MSEQPGNGDDEEHREYAALTDRDEVRRWADENDVLPVRSDRLEGERRHDLVRRDDVASHHEESAWEPFFEEFEDRELAVAYEDRGAAASGEHHLIERRDVADERGEVDEAAIGSYLGSETAETEVSDPESVEMPPSERDEMERETTPSATERSESAGSMDESTESTESGDEAQKTTSPSDEARESISPSDDAQKTTSPSDDSEPLERPEAETNAAELTEDTGVDDPTVETNAAERTEDMEAPERGAGRETTGEERAVSGEGQEMAATDLDDAGPDYEMGPTEDDEGSAASERREETKAAGRSDATESSDAAASSGPRSEDTDRPGEMHADREMEHPSKTRSVGANLEGISKRDMGKTVELPDGDEVGIVSDVDVDRGVYYVDEDPGLTDKIKANLLWGEDEDATTLQRDQVDQVRRDAIVVEESEGSR